MGQPARRCPCSGCLDPATLGIAERLSHTTRRPEGQELPGQDGLWKARLSVVGSALCQS